MLKKDTKSGKNEKLEEIAKILTPRATPVGPTESLTIKVNIKYMWSICDYVMIQFNGVNNVEKNGIEYVRTTIRFIGPAGQNKRKLEGEKELWKYSTVLMLNQKKSFASEISKIHISQIEGAQRGTGTTL